MIKFIATDLDGTLLNSKGELPQEIFPLVERLSAKGILFAPASGRQYANLKLLFAPVADKVVFICENGSLVKYRDQTLHQDTLDKIHIKGALDAVRALDHAYPLLCGRNCAYFEDDVEEFTSAAKAYSVRKRVENLDDVLGEDEFCKIAIYDELGAANHCVHVIPQQVPHLRTILSGGHWCDISSPTANKGAAIQVIQSHFGFIREECLAFGDHMNDLEMLSACGHTFVPENAFPKIKELFPHVIPSNNDGGVLQKLEEILSEKT